MATAGSQTDTPLRPPWAGDCTDWRVVLAEAVRDPAELCRLAGLGESAASAARRAADDFPVLVPRTYLERIRPGDPEDPLLVQVLPREAERASAAGFTTDPVGEAAAARRNPGLLCKYRSRVLIVATGACAVHCRFCFRRHFPYAASPGAADHLGPVLEQVAAKRSIREVILSGGDPLRLADEQLARLARRLARISHLRRLRLHTRMPVIIPQRVTDDLLGWLRGTRLAPIVVVHANHGAEIDAAAAAALGRLVDAGVPVLSQTVLLRGVNDRVDVLAELYERLIDLRVMPYYLHQLDRVAGAEHFEVPEDTGVKLIGQLRARLPGYAVPRYVRETPGGPSKKILA